MNNLSPPTCFPNSPKRIRTVSFVVYCDCGCRRRDVAMAMEMEMESEAKEGREGKGRQ
jgi:hypothetical protein